jgi:hypothetical protein
MTDTDPGPDQDVEWPDPAPDPEVEPNESLVDDGTPGAVPPPEEQTSERGRR